MGSRVGSSCGGQGKTCFVGSLGPAQLLACPLWRVKAYSPGLRYQQMCKAAHQWVACVCVFFSPHSVFTLKIEINIHLL